MSDTKLPAVIAGIKTEIIDQIKSIQSTYAISNLVDMDEVEKTMMIAQGIGALTRLLRENVEVVECLRYLQGMKLGYRVDDKGPYDDTVIVNVYVEAMMRGLQPTGNQYNIIAGNFYQTKEGFDHVISNLPGLTDWWIEWGDYKTDKSTAKVDFVATWIYKEKPGTIKGWVPVRVNSGSIVDAIYGKAERKVMARALKLITKSSAFDERDVSDMNLSPVYQADAKKLEEGDGKIT